MASIEKRTSKDGKVSYRVKVRLKGFPIQQATFERLTDARRWAQQTEAAIREGRHFKTTEAKRRTLGELIDRYIKDILPTKPKNSKNRTLHLNWWKEELGQYSLADICDLSGALRTKIFLIFFHLGMSTQFRNVLLLLSEFSPFLPNNSHIN